MYLGERASVSIDNPMEPGNGQAKLHDVDQTCDCACLSLDGTLLLHLRAEATK